MGSEWLDITLGEFLNLKRGYDLPKSKRNSGNIPIISSSGFSGNHDKPMVYGPGVVTGRYGTIGEVFYVNESYWPLNTTLYVDDFKGNSPLFCYYLLQTINFRAYSDKAAVPGINRNHIHMANIRVPKSVVTQDNIAVVLKKLEDKITNNLEINKTLEQITQALFNSWFVDFEPVKAKIAVLEAGGSQEEATLAAMTAISGKDADSLAIFEREHPEQYTELKATAELFPSAMQESELGETPEGWNVCNIKSSVTELRRGISPKYTEETDGVTVINQKCIRNHTINFSLARLHDSKKRTISGRELQVGDVLVNSTGTGTLGRLAPIRYLAETVIADSHVTVVRADTAKITASYLSGLLMKYEQFIESNGSGSTGQTELRKEVLEEIYFPCPPLILGQLFDKFTNRLNAKLSLLEQQITVLSQLRDTLLPKLLSGEITLPESEQAVSEAENV
ncbi:restriction endonuclease subunit S [Yersinia pseudotuberculosis]|uniref:Putative HsdS-like DNA methylase n=1 Tax=Yersinia pseudotuberculosis TaxID=633 RepID=Q6EVS9_YERPU|nr:restriction endonuclease subunit S [Yersinia pseudotuberculosis]AYW90828.1 restriction endonuclease subunit S [Yersinia pseudotuberculosis]MBO1632097.1 restriction endonuclease subunit S [Yersinia pseudotuberculosis]MBP0071767.1 restriction endonuclease subunit S [Yersinia pseudotuberculosis]CAF28524.1 putative HsdS-like DNA methylase [Yersinia pseudotuberculosis]CNE56464.1 Predicted nucleotidyltransferases [Yersinia pseudotuberculosis]